MSHLTDLQARLAETPCPFCGQGRLDLVLRCDVHADGCLFMARCESCRMHYQVDPESVPFAAPAALEAENLSRVTCPRCGGSDCRMTFRCTVASRRCAYAVVCPACGHGGA